MHNIYMPTICRCIECGFPTKDVWVIVPSGRKHPLCRKCQWKIPKAALNPYQQIIEDDHATGKGKAREKYKVTPEMTSQAVTLRNSGLGYADIAKRLGVSIGTAYKICRGAESHG